MYRKLFNKEFFLSASLLTLVLCVSIGITLAAEIFYSRSARSEDTVTQAIVYTCGNNIREVDEVCDGTDHNGEYCQSLGYDLGTLSCASDCSAFDTSQCFFANVCGNGIREDVELCDGNDLNSRSCLSFGYEEGDLGCSSDCANFIFDDCSTEFVSTSFCGNNNQELGEICDESDLGGKFCTSFGYDYGTLKCGVVCNAFDTSGCKRYQSNPITRLCGNNTIDNGEACDGTLLNSESCLSLGYDSGNLGCSSNCLTFDTSKCAIDLEVCDNGLDDDNNYYADCFDLGCMATSECLVDINELCYNGIDDDKDTYVDCFDTDCLGYEYCSNKLGENCGNDMDDNDNGLTDCEDPICSTHQLCYDEGAEEEPEEEEPVEELPETGDEQTTANCQLRCGSFVGIVLLRIILLVLFFWKHEDNDSQNGDSHEPLKDNNDNFNRN